MNRPAFEDSGNLHHINKAGVGTGADTYLIYFESAYLRNGLDVIRRVRTSRHRHDRGEINMDFFIIDRVVVCFQFRPYLCPVLRFEKGKRYVVRGENRCSGAKLCPHIGDSGSFGNRKRFHTLSAVFNDFTHAAFYGHSFEYLQDHVFRSHPRRELAGKSDPDDFRVCDVVSAAAHCDRNVKTARTDGNHSDTAAGRRMTVRADQRFSRNTEAFQMHLMTDTVAGSGKTDTMLFCDRTDKTMVVRIFKTVLQCVVVNVGNRAFCLYPRYAYRFKFQISHCTCGVLRERLIDFYSDLAAFDELTVNQMVFEYFFGQCQSHMIFPSIIDAINALNECLSHQEMFPCQRSACLTV